MSSDAPVTRRFESPCAPPWWARGGHAQTILGHVLQSPGVPLSSPESGCESFEVDVSEGDRLLVHTRAGDSGVRVLLFHGLSGSADSDYMQRAAAAFEKEGHDVWAVNHRGCGAGRGLASRPYHSGRYDDLARVIGASRERAPERKLIVVGFSLSGNAGLLLAGKCSEGLPDAVIAVNPPVDLEAVSNTIARRSNFLYELRFMRRLRRALRERVLDGTLVDPPRIAWHASLREFDEVFTAPQCGFDDARDYYRKCSSGPHLSNVNTKSVIITAADDPFIHPSVFDRFERSHAIHFHLEPCGGHVGYLERRVGEGYGYWLDRALVHYVRELALDTIRS